MRHEMDSLEKNHTWDLIPQPQRNNIFKFRWDYRTKFTSKGAIDHHKSNLVVKGFSQQKASNTLKYFLLL